MDYVQNQINSRISALALRDFATPGASEDTGLIDLVATDLPFNLIAFTQLGVHLRTASDQAIAKAATDSIIYSIQVEAYERVDTSLTDVSVANVKRSHISTANIYNKGGEIVNNTAQISGFNPDIIRIVVTNNLTGLSELSVTAME